MENIKVKTSELLEVLKTNRQKHKEEYKESIRAYRVKAAELLNRELQKAIAGKKFETSIPLTKPASHEKDYDLIIKMMEMTIDDTVSLTHNEFNQFANDEWSWKPNFLSTYYGHGTSGYSGTSGSSGTAGTSGTSGFAYKPYVDTETDGVDVFVTVNFAEDEV
jgi:hypothetical protein